MRVFSNHRRKIEPYRRYGSRAFRERVAKAKDYKRVFDPNRKRWWQRALSFFGLNRRLWRYAWVAGVAVIFYYLIISQFFLVSDFNVTGNREVKQEQIQDQLGALKESRLFLIPKNSLFLLSEGRVNKYLTQAIPDIKEIRNYRRTWPDKVSFEVVERNPGFILQSNNHNYLIDESGMVVKETDDFKNLPLVTDQLLEDFDPGQTIANSKLPAFVVTMARQWQDKVTSPLASIKIPGIAGTTAQFTSAEGWSAIFDTTRPVNGQLSNLALILSKQVPAKDRPNLAYIDLSLEKWAYYCFKNTPCSAEPQQNLTEGATQEGQPDAGSKK